MKKAIVGILACAMTVALAACAWMGITQRNGSCWESSTIVRVEGSGLTVGNLSLGYMRWVTSPADGNAGALLVRDGDLLYVTAQGKDAEKEENFFVPWRSEDGAKLSLKRDGPCLVLGERAVSLFLGKEKAGWDWVDKASESELISLRFVTVEETISDEQVRAFEKIARVNPHVGLSLADGTLLARAPSLDPRWLLIDEKKIAQAGLDAVAKRKAIETLFLSLENTDLNLQGLAALPNLRRLMLANYESAKSAMPDLPRLESLTFIGSTLQDLTPLKPLTGLKELNLTLGATISLKGIEALPQLQEVGVYCKDKASLDCAPLDGLKRLRWVALGPCISPDEFARVIQTHPDLQVVEVLKCEGIKSLAPLADLRELKALVFLPAPAEKGNEVSIEPFKQMKQLRLLILSEEVFKEKPGDLAELRGDLPDCVIAEGEPFCLGSGRILLLVPIVALGWMVIAGRRSRAA
ncbi:MAG: hypothetical protein ACLQVA_14635 [Candidatus Brocadiia bacterium]